ncbi:MAG: sugar transferase [Elusimicrobia bacterium]|nr:sugar transferase [Elusimicrobiota bacterium]
MAISAPQTLRAALRAGLHLVCDAAAVVAAYRLAYLWRFRSEAWVAAFPVPGPVPDWTLYAKLLYAVVPLWLMILWYAARLYEAPWLGLADRLIRIVKGCCLAAAAVMVATYVYSRLEYSRMMLMLALPISAVLVSASQALVLWLDSRLAMLGAARTALLIGGGAVAREVRARFLSSHPGAEVRELAALPPSAELERLLAESPCDEFILFEPALPHDRILEAAELCDARGTSFKMLPDILELRLGEVQMDHSLGLPAYRIQHGSLTAANFAAKRVFDLLFCLLVFLAAGLPWFLAALLIRLDSPGAVLYRQKRYGYKGRVFRMYKFRTMATDAEARLGAVQGLNSQGGAFFKAKGDPRVTRAGRWLRRFSLDELPQFINVLKGEMSVVGPRPLALATGELEALQAEFGATARKRMNVLPGITGLWQVSGRSDVSGARRFALDMFYIEHWSLGLDLEIILKTIPAMLSAKGAY